MTAEISPALARAQWVDVDCSAWDASASACELRVAGDGQLIVTDRRVIGGEVVSLVEGIDDGWLRSCFPHLARFRLWRLPAATRDAVPAMLRGALAVQGRDADGEPCAASRVQTAGVLDALYAEKARAALRARPLGVSWSHGIPTLSVWAPSARQVTLQLFTNGVAADPIAHATTREESTGIWRVVGAPSWRGLRYCYEVDVYSDRVGRFVTNTVTDPYSDCLTINSAHSCIVDLRDPALSPEEWETLRKPGLTSPVDAAIYELHVRDFSIYDDSVPPEHRGKYLAFTHAESRGMRHLQRLAQAGLTHVQLLPTSDFVTVDEDATRRTELDPAALALLPPDSEAQTTVIHAIRATDGYNWGYDPFHFGVPEGSYAIDPDGPSRIREFRAMVQALAACGLGVAVDMVFNHTFASGEDRASVLDKIVPGYYHRRSLDGEIEHSTCCENTASEHAMMEQLMVDMVRRWAVHYKVDGFRFDLMGHHMLRNMQAVRAALDELTLERDGVDGKRMLLYGEGWSFGEMYGDARGRTASQRNLGGSGIGSFNDRLRDAVRGGAPFADPRAAGFVSGMFFDAGVQAATDSLQRSRLETGDWLKIGLAGTLAEYELETLNGQRRGEQILYRSEPAGYARQPSEVINYVSAHDNETLFDKVQWAAPDHADIAQRVRMHLLALSFVAFAQGVPFFHAGDELLRSKSLDSNSYNSSDWFNAIDWSMRDSGWGHGLPPSAPHYWNAARALLRDPALRPTPDQAAFVTEMFCAYLRIRRQLGNFRLRTAEEIMRRVRFCNCGPQQTPGMIILFIEAAEANERGGVLAAWNAAAVEQSVHVPIVEGRPFVLHPILAAAPDSLVRRASWNATDSMLRLPPITAAVFI
jgi:pullulanase-type alpha-1,6-glucosidase